MGAKFQVEARSNLPEASASWQVDMGDDPAQSMLYTNLAYDLIAAAMAKLGVEMSKYVLDGDKGRLEDAMVEVQKNLRSGTV